jgi:hypothetical protein
LKNHDNPSLSGTAQERRQKKNDKLGFGHFVQVLNEIQGKLSF